jgi:hypothetical protein
MNLQTILSHPEKKKILENQLAEKIIGEIKNFLEILAWQKEKFFTKRQEDKEEHIYDECGREVYKGGEEEEQGGGGIFGASECGEGDVFGGG